MIIKIKIVQWVRYQLHRKEIQEQRSIDTHAKAVKSLKESMLPISLDFLFETLDNEGMTDIVSRSYAVRALLYDKLVRQTVTRYIKQPKTNEAETSDLRHYHSRGEELHHPTQENATEAVKTT